MGRPPSKLLEEATMNRGIAKKILQVVFIFFCLSVLVPAVVAAGTQSVSLTPATLSGAPGDTIRIGMTYENDAGKTTGIGIRIHFDSRVFSSAVFEDLYGEGCIASDVTSRNDTEDLDGDADTDKYLAVAWVGVRGDWPSFLALPLTLGKVILPIRPDAATGATKLNVTTAGTAAGHQFLGAGAVISIR